MNILLRTLRAGVIYIREHPQIILTLLLLVVIPFAFLYSGQQFLKVSKENQERLERDRVGLMHDIFASFILQSGLDAVAIQKEIENITALNPDITQFRVTIEQGGNIVPIAALDSNLVGEPELSENLFELSRVRTDESVLFEFFENDTRFWQGFRAIENPETGAVYYIFTEFSREQVDALFAERIRVAYYWLFGLLFVVLLLVFRHVRLINYSHLYQEVRRANEIKDLFSNMITHELRAPLTAIRGYASIIRERENIEDDVRTEAERIEDSAGRLLSIVTDLLDVARIQSGKLKVEMGKVHLNDVIQSVISTLEAEAHKKSIELSYHGTGNGPVVLADEKRLQQALINLVSNAVKYTKEGSIEISAEERGNWVQLRVKDTGMGIDASDQKKMFAPFFRVESDDVSVITGTGLGMWITKQLIEQMEGSIDIESIKGVGTHMVLSLKKPKKVRI